MGVINLTAKILVFTLLIYFYVGIESISSYAEDVKDKIEGVPPNIDDSISSSDVTVRENSNVSLSCHATGFPPPTVKWQREDELDIKINKSIAVREWKGNTLDFFKIGRLDMGVYFCIASNDVPPAVSKRIKVSVHFPPTTYVPQKLVQTSYGLQVTLECITEAHPAGHHYWTRDFTSMILDSRKYRTENVVGSPSYKTHMKLTIFDVQQKDFGTYNCVSRNPIGDTYGTIKLEVSPNIDDSMSSSSDVTERENSNVSLSCYATGFPPPTVMWQREDKLDIKINKSTAVREWEGETLDLHKIGRLDMGAYICTASNGVPPAASKRIKVSVDFPPMLYVPHKLVQTSYGSQVTLECNTEAHPNSLNYWTRDDSNRILDSRKYRTENVVGSPSYKIHMKLTIFDVQEKDFGTYKCLAKNPRGDTDGAIKLCPPSSTMTSTPPNTTTKPVKKSEGSSYRSSLSTNNSEHKRKENKNLFVWSRESQTGCSSTLKGPLLLSTGIFLAGGNSLWGYGHV